jgi:ABC-2 type transport system permease protein
MTLVSPAPGLAVWLRRLYVMMEKELLQLSRDVVLLFFIVYAFTVDIYLAGSGVSLQLHKAAFAVMDSDHSFASRELLYRFQLPHFNLVGEVANPEESMKMLDDGKAIMVITTPPNFEQSLLRGEPTSVQLQVDATNSVIGFLASSYAAQIVGQYGLETGLAREGFSASDIENVPRIDSRHRVWFNPNQNDGWFMSISELLTVITLFAILLPAAAMVREKERGTVEQLLVSPLTSFQIMFPKVVAMSAVILAGTLISLSLILKPVFDVPFKGDLLLFFSVTTLYVFTTAGLGLFAATIARNLAQAGLMTILILAPMIFLSGAWTPPEAMPAWLRMGMTISPLHYYMDASFGILLKGAGIDTLWPSILSIAFLGSIVFGFGLWRFRRQFH